MRALPGARLRNVFVLMLIAACGGAPDPKETDADEAPVSEDPQGQDAGMPQIGAPADAGTAMPDNGMGGSQSVSEPCTVEMEQVEACGLDPKALRRRTCNGAFWSEWSACADPESCTVPSEERRACGLNARGSSSRDCIESTWGMWSACVDPDACRDGDRDTTACGYNQRGSRTRVCETGQWQDVGPCLDPDECVDGLTQMESCGIGGQGTRTRMCTDGQLSFWSSCQGAGTCVNGQKVLVSCGLNARGETKRTCAEGTWSEPAKCWDPDVCVDGASGVSACGLNGRGKASARCVEGAWKTDACQDPDKCVDGKQSKGACETDKTREQNFVCENGLLVAVGECQVRACAVEDATQTQACGFNGRGTRKEFCWDGVWKQNPCVEKDSCQVGDQWTAACGLNRRGSWIANCRIQYFGTALFEFAPLAGQCTDLDECVDHQTRTQPCGDTGTGEQMMVCLKGLWIERGTCVESDACVEGEQSRGLCNNDVWQEQDYSCEGGALVPVSECKEPRCTDGDIEARACGPNGRGTMIRSCEGEVWQPFGPCDDRDTCKIGAKKEVACGLNQRGTGLGTCGELRGRTIWAGVQKADCKDPDLCIDGELKTYPCASGRAERQVCTEGQWTVTRACAD